MIEPVKVPNSSASGSGSSKSSRSCGHQRYENRPLRNLLAIRFGTNMTTATIHPLEVSRHLKEGVCQCRHGLPEMRKRRWWRNGFEHGVAETDLCHSCRSCGNNDKHKCIYVKYSKHFKTLWIINLQFVSFVMYDSCSILIALIAISWINPSAYMPEANCSSNYSAPCEVR